MLFETVGNVPIYILHIHLAVRHALQGFSKHILLILHRHGLLTVYYYNEFVGNVKMYYIKCFEKLKKIYILSASNYIILNKTISPFIDETFHL